MQRCRTQKVRNVLEELPIDRHAPVLRWVAGAYLLTDKSFRKIAEYENLWILAAPDWGGRKNPLP